MLFPKTDDLRYTHSIYDLSGFETFWWFAFAHPHWRGDWAARPLLGAGA